MLAVALASMAAPAAAAGEPFLPVEFSGRLSCGWYVEAGTTELEVRPLDEGALVRDQRRDIVARPLVLEMSDPRLDGWVELRLASDDLFFPGMGPSQPGIGWGTWRIETDEGGWSGPFLQARFSDTTRSTHTAALSGDGAYEGLTALWEGSFTNDRCGWSVRGVIVEGSYPPVQ